jgi:hypothetical protein
MDKFIRRIEEQVGRLPRLNIEALKARWEDVVSECRATAAPSYKDRGTMSYNGWTREGAQMVRDVSEAVTFERVLGMVGAVHLLNLERGFFISEEAFKCSMVELVRRTSRVETVFTQESRLVITPADFGPPRRLLGRDGEWPRGNSNTWYRRNVAKGRIAGISGESSRD